MKKLFLIPLIIIFAVEYFACLGHASPGMMGGTGGGASVVCTTSCNSTTYTNCETCTYYNRVIADGGTVINMAQVDVAESLIKSSSLPVAAWWNASFGVKKDGSGYITTLYDLSTNNKDCTGLGTTHKPQYIASTQNSKPGILFAASDNDCFSCGNLGLTGASSGFLEVAGSAGNTIYSSVLQIGDNGLSAILSLDIDATYYYRVVTGNAGQSVYNIATSAVSGNNTTAYIWDWKVSSAWKVDNLSYNNTSVGGAITNSITPGGTVSVIGAAMVAGSPSTYWNGYIGEVLFLSAEYTGGQYTAIRSYTTTWWGL
jgi:hypothetical protein